MIKVKGYAAYDARSPLRAYDFERRDLGPRDVLLDIKYSGVCHSDLHQARDEWSGMKPVYPMVPGHEIVGIVAAVGNEVQKFKIGDRAGVGVMTDSCRTCKPCKKFMEQYCVEGMTGTYNGYERDGRTVSQGGYSTMIVCDERWTYSISPKLDFAGVAPLLCAGITTYSPLRFAGVKNGDRVAVAGLGGLGHMAVKFAVAMGAEVSVISTSPSKEQDAKDLGAHHFIVSSNKEQMKRASSGFDVVLDAISGNHDYGYLLDLLDLEGKMMVVGLPSHAPSVNVFSLITNRRSVTGSMIGGTVETQEMLDYCAEKDIVADYELIRMQEINTAFERMLKGDVKYRFVIDMASLKAAL